MRLRRYSPRTEDAYWHWIERFLRHHRRPDATGPESWRHPREMGTVEVRDFLTHLAVGLHVSASTQNQALNALVFLCGQVLNQPLGEFGDFARAIRPPRLPVVLTRRDTSCRSLRPAAGPCAATSCRADRENKIRGMSCGHDRMAEVFLKRQERSHPPIPGRAIGNVITQLRPRVSTGCAGSTRWSEETPEWGTGSRGRRRSGQGVAPSTSRLLSVAEDTCGFLWCSGFA